MGPLAPLLVERAEEVLPVDRAVAGLGVEGRALQRCCHLPKSAILRTSDHPQSSDSFRYKMATDRTLTTGEKFERLVGTWRGCGHREVLPGTTNRASIPSSHICSRRRMRCWTRSM